MLPPPYPENWATMAEALSIASGVAGLISLMGYSIEGIIKLRAFAKGVKVSTSTVLEFVADLDAFSLSLQQIRDLLEKVPNNVGFNMTAFERHLQACQSSIVT
jgi:hypothetical protein